MESVPNVKPIVRALDAKVLATNKLSLLYFSFLLFNKTDKNISAQVAEIPYILIINTQIQIVK